MGQNSLLTVVDALAFLAATRKKVAFCATDRQDKNILMKVIKNTKYDKAFEAKRTLLYLRKEITALYTYTLSVPTDRHGLCRLFLCTGFFLTMFNLTDNKLLACTTLLV